MDMTPCLEPTWTRQYFQMFMRYRVLRRLSRMKSQEKPIENWPNDMEAAAPVKFYGGIDTRASTESKQQPIPEQEGYAR